MAVSVASTYFDFFNILDPIRILQGFDCPAVEQMENGTVDYKVINNQTSSASHQELEQLIDFVDSPPDSKEAWPSDYLRSSIQTNPMVDIQESTAVANRKRRMDWEDTLDVTDNSVSTPKIPFNGPNGTQQQKECERVKKSGRQGWSDEIDFDLNNELSSNGYGINESLLYSSLTVLKQEVPSPTQDVHKNLPQLNGGTVNDSTKRQHSGNENIVPSEQQQQPLQKPQQQQQQQQQPQNGVIESNQHIGLHHLLQDNDFEATNGSGQSQDGMSSGVARKETPISDDCRFQYVLAAATSIATKSNEDTLTYLNQGQSYEIKLKKLGDLSPYRNKILRSIIKICFHERRLQYMEKEQMQQWQSSRPGERIVEVDVPLSYGLCHVSQPANPNLLNTVEILWDPMKEVGVYIKVNCISTEFTPKKHGGEKGVPFRIQVETYLDTKHNGDAGVKPIHAAACQIKVFKLKGADRKHKQDREKIQKRPPSEQEKYQPSYECTILNDISSDMLVSQVCYSPDNGKAAISPIVPNSPVHVPKYDGVMQQFPNTNSNPIAINNVSSTNSAMCKIIDQSIMSPAQMDSDEMIPTISKDSTPAHLTQWMNYHRLTQYVNTFAHFSGGDLLRMSKEDLIQICGLADGIRMYNILHAKAITPRLTIFVSFDGSCYHAVYMHSSQTKELLQKLSRLPGFYENQANGTMNGTDGGNMYNSWGMQSKFAGSGSNLYDASKFTVFIHGPNGIHVLVTDDVIGNMKDESLFTLDVQNGKILMKAVYKTE
ncbi:transcription factor CP2-like protein 1 isoform X2 [Lutzomyia longipalpis]|uniref:transcription factor CP2-like protein 1 isoform X2 n=1 Tax=Lutzomyia longipalpis TaxID=7200 RepID=UPI0024835523|nr:transcription factor CP2-like protein 1 isoform X2 [Lutzomyia longipalpis]